MLSLIYQNKANMIIKRLDARYTKPHQMRALVIIDTDKFYSTSDTDIIHAVKKSKFNILATEKGIQVIDRYKLSRDITAETYNTII